MSTPIIEYIAQDIEAAVNAIAIAAGFNQDLTAVRPRRNDFSDIVPENGKVLIAQTDEVEAAAEALTTEQWFQTFVLMALVIDSDNETESIDKRCNRVRADIQKKLIATADRGGYAIDTILGESAIFDDGEGFTGIAVSVAVHYRVKHDDPYTKI